MDVVTAVKIWTFVKPIKRLKERRQRKRRLRELGIEDKTMLRTSTGAGLAGIAVNILLQILQAFPATAELAASPEVASGLTAVAMWFVARLWKTPAQPGKL